MKPGDIVKLESVFNAPIPLYSTWGNKEGGGDKTNGNIHPHEIGVVLETTEPRGGNGARIMVSGGRIGWVNLNFLENKT
jgi:hypothetical protein